MTEQVQITEQNLHEEREKLLKGTRLHWFHWLVIVASLLLTLGAWYISKHQIEAKNQLRFDRAASQVVEMIFDRMQRYEDGLWGGVAAIQTAGGDISLEDWRTFAENLRIDKKFPGINGLGVIHYVTPDKLQNYLQRQARRRPDFRIHPPHEKAEYWPISYIIPEAPNASAVGLDMAHESNRHSAGQKARDTGQAQITGPITLVQDAAKTPGFLFYAPFFANGIHDDTEARRKNFTGMVYAPFVMSKLMDGTLSNENRFVSMRIRDKDAMLYDDHTDALDPNPIFSKTINTELYGRTWTFEIASNKAFRIAATNHQPIIILIGGISIDGMLLALFILLSQANRRAIKFADKMSTNYDRKSSELASVIDRLASSNEELERFAYVASHDLQEPLRMVSNFTQLLKARYEDKLDDDGIKYINIANDSALRMQELVDDLLEYARIGDVSEKMDYIDCNDTLAYIQDNLQEQIADRNAIISYESDVATIFTNPVRFSRVLQNLIGNSIKYCAPDVEPVVKIGLEDEADHWLVSVKDNGIGMRQEYCEQIFLPFKRLHGQSEFQGSGIGLTICRKIVESAGGKIWATAKVGEGSLFQFSIPKNSAVEEIARDRAA